MHLKPQLTDLGNPCFFINLFINILVCEIYSPLSNATDIIVVHVSNISNGNQRKMVKEHEL